MFFEDTELAEPFLATTLDPEFMTGSDIYKTMLAASLGEKSLIGASTSGAGEVLNKVSYKFASNKATGYLRFNTTDMDFSPLDSDGKIVAKSGSKFYGISKASAFTVVRESTVWSTSAMNRVKAAATLAASVAGSGVSIDKAAKLASDALGEDLGEDILQNVVTPLSLAKRDAATTSKRRHAIFLPDHFTQDISWDDKQLNGTLLDDSDAIDWGRMTTIAKCIGACNAALDPKFKALASVYSIPFAMVDNHWTKVTMAPYVEIANRNAYEGNLVLPSSCTVRAKEKVAGLKELVRTDLVALNSKVDEYGAILRAMSAVKIPKVKVPQVLATEVLEGYKAHKVTEDKAHLLVEGSQSSYNAVVSAVLGKVRANPELYKNYANFASSTYEGLNGEGEYMATLKLLAEASFDTTLFLSAAAILGNELNDYNLAQHRVATLRRSLTATSSAMTDNLAFTARTVEGLGRVVTKVAKIIRTGRTGYLPPPAILASPASSIAAGRKMELLKEAVEYLEHAKRFWSTAYDNRARYTRVTEGLYADVVKLSVTAKAFKKLTPEQLVNWEDGYVSDMNKSYMKETVDNYARKRSKATLSVVAEETVWDYARRADIHFDPEVGFLDVAVHVAQKLSFLAADFGQGQEFNIGSKAINGLALDEIEDIIYNEGLDTLEEELTWAEDTELLEEAEKKAVEVAAAVPKVPALEVTSIPNIDDLFGDLFSMEVTFGHQDISKYRSTWPENFSSDSAAIANGFASYDDAIAELGEDCIYDPDNAFTKVAIGKILNDELLNQEEGNTNVI